MTLPPTRARPQASIPTSSMADIAFLLLVFFLVTTVFPREHGLALALPHEESPVPAGNVLHFIVSPTGAVEVRHGDSPQGRVVRAGEVAAVWRDAVAANPRLIAAVRTSGDAAYGDMLAVLDGLHAAGARRISLQLLGG